MSNFLEWQAQLSWSQGLLGMLLFMLMLIGLVMLLAWCIVALQDRGAGPLLRSYERTLRGVSSCSTCPACRNAAQRTLKGEFL